MSWLLVALYSDYSMTSLYYRLGTFYFNSKRYVQAEKYYHKAYDELNIIQSYFSSQLVNEINLQIANSKYLQDNKKEANEIFKDILDSCEDYELEQKKSYQIRYLGNKYE